MTIIVTGCSRGIGYQVVKNFSSTGNHRIIAMARNVEKLAELKSACESMNNNTMIYTLPFDLEKDDAQQKLIPVVKDFLGTIDIVIFNAGYLVNKPFAEINEEDFDRSIQVNVKSVFFQAQALVPLLSENAHLLTISSMGGYQGSSKFAGLSAYSTSKGALAVLTECLAEELKPKGIKVNCLALGAVQTEMIQEAFPGYQAPLKASEMAAHIVDFALNGHKYYNGKILPVSLSTP